MATINVFGSYHKVKITAELNEETRATKITAATLEDKPMPKKFGLVGKSFATAREAGRAAFDAITDFEDAERLPDARFMTLKRADGKGIGSTAPKAAKPKAEPKAKAEKVVKPAVKATPAKSTTKTASGKAEPKTTAKATSAPKAAAKATTKSAPKSKAKSADVPVSASNADESDPELDF